MSSARSRELNQSEPEFDASAPSSSFSQVSSANESRQTIIRNLSGMFREVIGQHIRVCQNPTPLASIFALWCVKRLQYDAVILNRHTDSITLLQTKADTDCWRQVNSPLVRNRNHIEHL